MSKFSKTSRYRKLPDIVTIDTKGQVLESKTLRLLPDVSDQFLHTVEEIDRIDHLAYKYYKKPRKWWRICDANPEFMSPQALLEKEPIVTTRFPLTFNGNGSQPPWADLLKNLSEKLGVEDIKVMEDIQLVQEEQTHDERQVIVYVERFNRSVSVTYNQMNVSAEDLADVMTNAGFEVGQIEKISRIGKNIIIPQDTVG
jgi:hypothetical protein